MYALSVETKTLILKVTKAYHGANTFKTDRERERTKFLYALLFYCNMTLTLDDFEGHSDNVILSISSKLMINT